MSNSGNYYTNSNNSESNCSENVNFESFNSDNINNNAIKERPSISNFNNNISESDKNGRNESMNSEKNALPSASIEFRKPSDLKLNLRTNKATTEIKCLLCSYTDMSAGKIEEHINRQHFDLTSPSLSKEENEIKNFKCPLCPKAFESTNHLESHVNVDHTDIISPVKEDNQYKNSSVFLNTCPICDLFTSTSSEELSEHVELHFSTYLSPDVSKDGFIAKELLKEDQERFRLEQQREFEFLQAQYGMDNEGNFREQSMKNMQKAVYSGELTVSDFYEKQVELKMAENYGVDDGTSCITNIMPCITEKSKNCANVAQTYLCSNLDFYAASYGDRGWGCGYRNLQMMLSSLFREKRYCDLLSKQLSSKFRIEKSPSGSLMPSISRLQQMIEWAWSQGFDEQGREQLGNRVHNTRKWIGATEIITLLSSLRFRCQCVDIHRSSSDGSHPKMFDWILKYFKKPEAFKPPLYLQHQGHSRTVVGVEVLKDGELLLLILDPGIGTHQLEKSLSDWNAPNSLKLLRKSLYNLKSDQFQIATVVGVVTSEQEYQANKIIRSTKIF